MEGDWRFATLTLDYPPGTSKWNPGLSPDLIRGASTACSVTSHRTGVPHRSPAALPWSNSDNTSTKTGLTVYCELDTNTYLKGIKVSDEERATLSLKGDDFHPDWNYTISPRDHETER
jgi:hypothetical protein